MVTTVSYAGFLGAPPLVGVLAGWFGLSAVLGIIVVIPTLGLAPLAGQMPGPLRAARALGTPLYDFRGLRAFKGKLRPGRWDPILLAYPGAQIFSFDDGTIRKIAYEDCPAVQVMGSFMKDRKRFLRHLFQEDEEDG